jgi:SAM-dependent methyltransferase
VSSETRSRWGARAAGLYTDVYAERYRGEDDAVRPGQAAVRLSQWLRGICEQFDGPIDVLDLGCGTGRYFHSVHGARRLVGIDVSAPMLERARRPAGSVSLPPGSPVLVEADFLTYEFAPAEFDLVYAIGVLGEHSPFDVEIAGRVSRWLKPGGRFAFTTVDPFSPSVPRTLRRRAGESLIPLAPSALKRSLRSRLMRDGLYADGERVREVLEAVGLTVESMGPFESDAHLHVLAVARKSARGSSVNK